ncbi:hypothetical protein FVB9288_02303 [Flavobacterium sp. CECT 9288]|uniref:DUF3127 domain-containing protein n=1 Tax=Flavobacterium sp. CECT 9288 TaxID=2845819 RepID=UPI001E5C2294|nr:DUF3127 domain-containing protein [Flavobacterium sp. CECT 9288]CAH0336595.1 hypothetical protein FVB9288_02303 [Flavobacterium sp. CECT 9288]
MIITAKLIQLLPIQTGLGKNGQWKKQDVIVETDSQYSKKICVSIWGDKIIENQLQIGNSLTISYELESREYNGKWYTDVKAFKIEVVNNPLTITPNSSFENTVDLIEDDEDLPF